MKKIILTLLLFASSLFAFEMDGIWSIKNYDERRISFADMSMVDGKIIIDINLETKKLAIKYSAKYFDIHQDENKLFLRRDKTILKNHELKTKTYFVIEFIKKIDEECYKAITYTKSGDTIFQKNPIKICRIY